MPLLTGIAALSIAIWMYLILGRGGFWLARERDDPVTAEGTRADALWSRAASASRGRSAPPEFAQERREVAPPGGHWPAVTAVIPARDEADVVDKSIGSLLRQDYPGPFTIILVDDQSRDGTADAARACAAASGAGDRLIVVRGRALPAGWSGKLWAIHQGAEQVGNQQNLPEYLLLTDADIAYAPDTLRSLVARAQASELVLVSLMAKLRCESFAEQMLIPAFIFFFQMLYPFGWVNRPRSTTAAAAGGCMLVRREALESIGGIASIRGALIDDCTLAKALKRIGPVWLGLTERARSLRPYARLQDIRRMVSRSAYDQLNYSPLLLSAAVVGLTVTFFVPPLLALFGSGWAQAMAAIAWLLMAIGFQPILRFYRVSPLWGVALPAIAAFYLAFTLDSAYQHWRGRGGLWKGRVQANLTETR